MPKKHMPRSGSMQFWPRKRSKRHLARVRSWPESAEARPLGFAGYKAGMTHALIIDNKVHTKTKGKEVFCPMTIIECPPLKALSVRFYKTQKMPKKLLLVSEILAEKPDKELSRKITLAKTVKKKFEDIKPESYDEVRLLVYTLPRLTSIGKKKPDIFELGIGGKKQEQLSFARSKLGSEIKIDEVFSEGQQADMHVITKGKGFQGPVKRFGIGLKSHKSEKGRRTPGSLGGWKSQGKVMYRVAHAGQMGMYKRVALNSLIIKMGAKPEEINPAGGFINYGLVKNSYILFRGSVPGPKKRLVVFTLAQRLNRKVPKEAPQISYLSLKSKQGN